MRALIFILLSVFGLALSVTNPDIPLDGSEYMISLGTDLYPFKSLPYSSDYYVVLEVSSTSTENLHIRIRKTTCSGGENSIFFKVGSQKVIQYLQTCDSDGQSLDLVADIYEDTPIKISVTMKATLKSNVITPSSAVQTINATSNEKLGFLKLDITKDCTPVLIRWETTSSDQILLAYTNQGPSNFRARSASTCPAAYKVVHDGDNAVYGASFSSSFSFKANYGCLPIGTYWISYENADYSEGLSDFSSVAPVSISVQSEYCPYLCSNQGYCTNGKCVCNHGFTGDDCSQSSSVLSSNGEIYKEVSDFVIRIPNENVEQDKVLIVHTDETIDVSCLYGRPTPVGVSGVDMIACGTDIELCGSTGHLLMLLVFGSENNPVMSSGALSYEFVDRTLSIPSTTSVTRDSSDAIMYRIAATRGFVVFIVQDDFDGYNNLLSQAVVLKGDECVYQRRPNEQESQESSAFSQFNNGYAMFSSSNIKDFDPNMDYWIRINFAKGFSQYSFKIYVSEESSTCSNCAPYAQCLPTGECVCHAFSSTGGYCTADYAQSISISSIDDATEVDIVGEATYVSLQIDGAANPYSIVVAEDTFSIPEPGYHPEGVFCSRVTSLSMFFPTQSYSGNDKDTWHLGRVDADIKSVVSGESYTYTFPSEHDLTRVSNGYFEFTLQDDERIDFEINSAEKDINAVYFFRKTDCSDGHDLYYERLSETSKEQETDNMFWGQSGDDSKRIGHLSGVCNQGTFAISATTNQFTEATLTFTISKVVGASCCSHIGHWDDEKEQCKCPWGWSGVNCEVPKCEVVSEENICGLSGTYVPNPFFHDIAYNVWQLYHMEDDDDLRMCSLTDSLSYMGMLKSSSPYNTAWSFLQTEMMALSFPINQGEECSQAFLGYMCESAFLKCSSADGKKKEQVITYPCDSEWRNEVVPKCAVNPSAYIPSSPFDLESNRRRWNDNGNAYTLSVHDLSSINPMFQPVCPVTSAAISSAAITSASISSSITSASVTSDAITPGSAITSAPITSAAIMPGSVTSSAITSASITSAAMNNGAVTSSAITTSTSAVTLASVTQVTATIKFNNNYIGQLIIPVRDSVNGFQTTFTFGANSGDDFHNKVLYVFDGNPYTGSPSSLNSITREEGLLTKVTCKNGISWIFPSKIVFKANVQYYFYLDSPVSGTYGYYTPTRRDIDQPYLVSNDGSQPYTEVQSSLVFSLESTHDDGSGAGDPYFVGFNNQKFEFDGVAGNIYNIYNDHYMNLNSLFGVAHTRSGRGTVMIKMGLSIGEHNISIDVNDKHSDQFLVTIDGTLTTISEDPIQLSGCVDLQFKNELLITTPKHDIYLTPRKGRSRHINVPYLDLHIHHPEEDVTKIGGVLGQTASNIAVIDKNQQHFVVGSIFSFESSKYYDLTTIEC